MSCTFCFCEQFLFLESVLSTPLVLPRKVRSNLRRKSKSDPLRPSENSRKNVEVSKITKTTSVCKEIQYSRQLTPILVGLGPILRLSAGAAHPLSVGCCFSVPATACVACSPENTNTTERSSRVLFCTKVSVVDKVLGFSPSA